MVWCGKNLKRVKVCFQFTNFKSFLDFKTRTMVWSGKNNLRRVKVCFQFTNHNLNDLNNWLKQQINQSMMFQQNEESFQPEHSAMICDQFFYESVFMILILVI